jgi:hypothetical protein
MGVCSIRLILDVSQERRCGAWQPIPDSQYIAHLRRTVASTSPTTKAWLQGPKDHAVSSSQSTFDPPLHVVPARFFGGVKTWPIGIRRVRLDSLADLDLQLHIFPPYFLSTLFASDLLLILTPFPQASGLLTPISAPCSLTETAVFLRDGMRRPKRNSIHGHHASGLGCDA